MELLITAKETWLCCRFQNCWYLRESNIIQLHYSILLTLFQSQLTRLHADVSAEVFCLLILWAQTSDDANTSKVPIKLPNYQSVTTFEANFKHLLSGLMNAVRSKQVSTLMLFLHLTSVNSHFLAFIKKHSRLMLVFIFNLTKLTLHDAVIALYFKQIINYFAEW